MSITFVQSNTNAGTGLTSLVVTLAAAPTVGNLLVARLSHRADRAFVIATGWTLAIHQDGYTLTDIDGAICYRISDGTETSSTWGIDGSGFIIAEVAEWSGIAASPFDIVAGANDGGPNTQAQSTGTTAATTQADELIVGMWGAREQPTGRSITNGFVERTYRTVGTPAALVTADKVVSATGIQESTLSWTSTAAPAIGAVATFKAAVSATVPEITATLAVETELIGTLDQPTAIVPEISGLLATATALAGILDQPIASVPTVRTGLDIGIDLAGTLDVPTAIVPAVTGSLATATDLAGTLDQPTAAVPTVTGSLDLEIDLAGTLDVPTAIVSSISGDLDLEIDLGGTLDDPSIIFSLTDHTTSGETVESIAPIIEYSDGFSIEDYVTTGD